MFVPTTILVLSLITSEKLLLITNPFLGVKEAYVHYHFSNVPKRDVEEEKPDWPDQNWMMMKTSVMNGLPGFMANLSHVKNDDMFLRLQYRFVFPNRDFKDSDWQLKIWNTDRLHEYFYTSVWWILLTTFLSISLIGVIVIYVLYRQRQLCRCF